MSAVAHDSQIKALVTVAEKHEREVQSLVRDFAESVRREAPYRSTR